MSSQLSSWLVFILGGLVTYLQRASFLLFFGQRNLPESVQRALRYVAPAAFAAIVAPRVIGDLSPETFTAPDARLLAAIGAAVFMRKIPNMPLLLVFGMSLFWTLRWLGL